MWKNVECLYSVQIWNAIINISAINILTEFESKFLSCGC